MCSCICPRGDQLLHHYDRVMTQIHCPSITNSDSRGGWLEERGTFYLQVGTRAE